MDSISVQNKSLEVYNDRIVKDKPPFLHFLGVIVVKNTISKCGRLFKILTFRESYLS